ncbi:MAG: HAMP domain-containing histidine kinase [Roseburia sp.]|nr:HAMP domain-containing histidine kinase [Roseburia sp.]
MKKWKGSTAAKIAAWILLTVSAVVCVGSVVAIIGMTDGNIYTDSEAEVREEAFATVANRYSLLAAYNYHNGADEENEKFFADTSFQYGIIEGDSIEGLDLNADKTYLERNFSQEVAEQELHVFSMELNDNTSISYKNGFLLGHAFISNHGSTYTSRYVNQICYDSFSGILYYKTLDDEYFPVQYVQFELGGNTYYLYYDVATGQYTQRDKAEAGEDATAMQELLAQGTFNFNMLEEVGITRDKIGTLLLDGVREIPMKELTSIDIEASGLSENVTLAEDYYLDENYTLQVDYRGENQKEYTVVSVIPEETALAEGNPEDMYVQADKLVSLMYRWRYPVFVVCILTLVLAVGSFLFLLSAAGHRKGTEEIVLLPTDYVWLDVSFAVFCAAELFLLYVMQDCSYELPENPFLFLFLLAGLCMGWLLLWFLLSFAVRCKKGKWWRNTLIYKIAAPIGRFLRMVWHNMDFLWKWIFVLAFLAFCEFVGLLMFQYETGSLLLLWFLEKAVLYVLILCGLVQMRKLKEGAERMAAGDLLYKVDTNRMAKDFKRHGENLNSISEGMSRAVDERMKSERFKTELITNVSHDIKTPLTSIINYVDLLEKEKLENATAEEYLEVLDRQSGRLKKLIEDLIEASKASTGNLAVHLERLEAGVFMVQTVGEFEEKTRAAELDLQIKKPEQPVYIMADGRHLWRVIDNLMNNICKYAQPGTRVYINMEEKGNKVEITFRNTSKYPLNISSDELMERFVRGDSSRNTEGSGLGLSIANSLMELMGGTFRLHVDGDLFKVVLEFEEASA